MSLVQGSSLLYRCSVRVSTNTATNSVVSPHRKGPFFSDVLASFPVDLIGLAIPSAMVRQRAVTLMRVIRLLRLRRIVAYFRSRELELNSKVGASRGGATGRLDLGGVGEQLIRGRDIVDGHSVNKKSYC